MQHQYFVIAWSSNCIFAVCMAEEWNIQYTCTREYWLYDGLLLPGSILELDCKYFMQISEIYIQNEDNHTDHVRVIDYWPFLILSLILILCMHGRGLKCIFVHHITQSVKWLWNFRRVPSRDVTNPHLKKIHVCMVVGGQCVNWRIDNL